MTTNFSVHHYELYAYVAPTLYDVRVDIFRITYFSTIDRIWSFWVLE